MKSYFLEHVSSLAAAETALRAELPGQEGPWIIWHAPGDAVAYLSIGADLDGEPNLHIQADVSGRHYEKDHAVIAVLERVQRRAGGTVIDDV